VTVGLQLNGCKFIRVLVIYSFIHLIHLFILFSNVTNLTYFKSKHPKEK